MTNVDAIAARLGSVSLKALAGCPDSVQTLLREDLPNLIEAVRQVDNWIEQMDPMLDALNTLHGVKIKKRDEHA